MAIKNLILQFKIWIYSKYRFFIFTQKVKFYSCRYPKIRSKVASKDRIKVVFFVINIGMWKGDRLFQLLLGDDRFDPYAISFLYPDDPFEYRRCVQDEMRTYFTEKGFPFINGYDFDTRQWFNISDFQPDIVFYAQPYNIGYKGFLIESLWRHTLFAYIPYAAGIEKNEVFYKQLYFNVCWKIFVPTRYHQELFSQFLLIRRSNSIISGFALAEEFAKKDADDRVWKIADKKIKRVIWAPHHSILENDELHYSNFLSIADQILDLTKKFENSVQFAFKPHPRLRNKLYGLQEWGVERTDHYYQSWASGKNTIFIDGQYVDLFLTSDALIHDSSSFMAEYLFTHKPLMFITKGNSPDCLNQFGKDCYDLHYKGQSIQDIEKFINDVVIAENDPMKMKRMSFYNENLASPNNMLFADNVYRELKNLSAN